MNTVAIIVPFRIQKKQNREWELQQFIPHMETMMNQLVNERKIQSYHIYVIEQNQSQKKFNRGLLLNIGANFARQSYPTTYDANGYVDIVRSSHVLNSSNLHGDKMLVYDTPYIDEIDTKNDLDYIKYNLLPHHLTQNDQSWNYRLQVFYVQVLLVWRLS